MAKLNCVYSSISNLCGLNMEDNKRVPSASSCRDAYVYIYVHIDNIINQIQSIDSKIDSKIDS
jgi:hypothetical protein